MFARTNVTIALWSSAVLLAVAASALTLLARPTSAAVETSAASARAALSSILEWGKWVALSEVGMVTVLASRVSAGSGDATVATHAASIFGAVFLAAGILISAWLLSTIPFVQVSVGQWETELSTQHDVLEYAPYSYRPISRIRLGRVVILQHALWLVGGSLFAIAQLTG